MGDSRPDADVIEQTVLDCHEHCDASVRFDIQTLGGAL
jgi:hypothetical protein